MLGFIRCPGAVLRTKVILSGNIVEEVGATTSHQVIS